MLPKACALSLSNDGVGFYDGVVLSAHNMAAVAMGSAGHPFLACPLSTADVGYFAIISDILHDVGFSLFPP